VTLATLPNKTIN